MTQAISIKDRVRIKHVEVLSDDWYVLRKTTYDYLGRNGQWRELTRETYDRGNGATILLYSKAKQTVVLTRQFRFPAFVNGHDDLLIETCAGLLDNDDPHTCIRKETQEETGYIIQDVRKVFDVVAQTTSQHYLLAVIPSLKINTPPAPLIASKPCRPRMAT